LRRLVDHVVVQGMHTAISFVLMKPTALLITALISSGIESKKSDNWES
jgi:hypothetical protein